MRKKEQISTPVEQSDGLMLPLMEAFYTIQGEGYHSGKPAYFVRIGGCDVACHWCDVKESWDAELYPLTRVEQIAEEAARYPAKAVVVTGGEPLMYPMDFLTQKLKEKNITTYLETSGAYPLSGQWDWICLSPKKKLPPLPGIFQLAAELKVIIYNRHDFMWAEQHASHVNTSCKLFLQPEWSRSSQILPAIIEYVKNHPKWNISLQSHKYMGIP